MRIKNLCFLLMPLFLIMKDCQLPVEQGIHEKVISEDTTEIYYMDLETKSYYKLTDGERPEFIPNSNKIVYGHDEQILTYDLLDSSIHSIANANGLKMHRYQTIEVSTDGECVLFIAPAYNSMDIFLATTNSDEFINISKTDSLWDFNYRFTPDENYILYKNVKRVNDKVHYEFFKTDLLGNRKQIIPDIPYTILGFSDNGEKIVYYDLYGSEDSSFTKIVIGNYPSLSIEKEIYFADINFSYMPKLSDDMKLYYTIDETNIYCMDLNTEETEVIYNGAIKGLFAFNNDFTKILIGGLGIKFIDLYSGETRQLFTDWDNYFQHVRFSPDGKGFIFVKTVYREVEYYN